MLWRTASAAAHGKAWFVDVTHTTAVGDECAPGHFRAIRRPEPETVSAVVRLASSLTQWGVLRLAQLAGLDFDLLFAVSLDAVHAHSPQTIRATGS